MIRFRTGRIVEPYPDVPLFVNIHEMKMIRTGDIRKHTRPLFEGAVWGLKNASYNNDSRKEKVEVFHQ